MAPAHPPIPSVQARRRGLVSDLPRLGDRIRHGSLLSWPVVLFLILICVPPIALIILGANPNASTFDHVAWIFAAYFGIAWLLLLGIIIRPEQVTKSMLVLVTAIALATQVPLAITLESDLHASTTGLGPSIYTVGLPEELGLAVTRRHKWYSVAWIGLAAAAVLHGLNDWGRVNGQPLWIVVVAVSGILFLGFAKAGSGGTAQSTGQSTGQPTGDALPPAFRLRGASARHAPVSPGGHPKPGAMSGSRSSRPWWEH